jgi:hypothetical protein
VSDNGRVTADDLVQGAYDGVLDTEEKFNAMIYALQHQLRAASMHVLWTFTWEGRKFDKRTVPLKVWRHWQQITGQSYTTCHPDNAEHAYALIFATLRAEGVDAVTARDQADNASGWEIAHSKIEEVTEGVPFGSTSTTSSTSSPDDPGTGPPPSPSTSPPATSPDNSPEP